VAIIESVKKTLTRLLAPTSNLTWLWVAVRNRKIGIAMMRIWLRVDYQSERRFSGFQRFIQESQPVNGLRVMIFRRWRGFWKLYFCSDCRVERKINFGAVWVGFFPWVEYQKLGHLSQIFIRYLFSLIQLIVYKVRNFEDRLRCWILFLDRIASKRNSTFGSRIGWNSRSPEYHCGRKLSYNSYGP
jgi:hypothetical protein